MLKVLIEKDRGYVVRELKKVVLDHGCKKVYKMPRSMLS